MSLSSASTPILQASGAASFDPETEASRRIIAYAAWHSLLWLVVANCVGVLLAAMLLMPGINLLLGQWTYGRWMPVHMNLQLYGWCSLPLVAFLLHVYGVRHRICSCASSVLWLWSAALGVGAVSWLGGHSSGKLFLDWTGYSRVLYPLALVCLWALLTGSFIEEWRKFGGGRFPARVFKIVGLILLLIVPVILYIASDPALYPPVNPDSGGPTGASQLESALVIVAILLLLPFGMSARKRTGFRIVLWAWVLFVVECILCLGLGRADVSHHKPTQWISLGSLLLWIPLTPAYYTAFCWHENTRRWRIAFLCWWSVLIPTGWMLFLPGVLDHFKFTDGLVGHSLLAMAGFASSLLIFVLVQLMGEDGWIFNRTWSFYVWHASVASYVAIMFFAGWEEGLNPAFSIVPGLLRNGIYAVRLLLGILILAASLDWFTDSFVLFKEFRASTSRDATVVST